MGPIFAIAVPTRANLSATAFEALTRCCLETALWWKGMTQSEGRFLFMTYSRGQIGETRSLMADELLRLGAEWVLWLDDDAIPYGGLAARLHAHQKDMVAPFFTKRVLPFKTTVKRWTGDRFDLVDPLPAEPFRADLVGMHCVLMRGEVLLRCKEHLGDGVPLFQFNQLTGVSEDYFFMQTARDVGAELWIDPTVEVGHLGEIVCGRAEMEAAHGYLR